MDIVEYRDGHPTVQGRELDRTTTPTRCSAERQNESAAISARLRNIFTPPTIPPPAESGLVSVESLLIPTRA
jgi:hypothetical protein